MAGRTYRAKIESVEEVAPQVLRIRFTPQVRFPFQEGQFLSLLVKDPDEVEPIVWRAYSLANASESKDFYELCVRLQPGGRAGKYLQSLSKGEWVEFRAPYGDFMFKTPADRGACFIGTGTGVVPLRSIVRSAKFRKEPPLFSLALLGFRYVRDILYRGDFEEFGVKTYYAISDEKGSRHVSTKGGDPVQSGRITDLLTRLKDSFPWTETDFYLCGNGAMIVDAIRYLRAKGVDPSAIHAEAFGGTPPVKKEKAA